MDTLKLSCLSKNRDCEAMVAPCHSYFGQFAFMSHLQQTGAPNKEKKMHLFSYSVREQGQRASNESFRQVRGKGPGRKHFVLRKRGLHLETSPVLRITDARHSPYHV